MEAGFDYHELTDLKKELIQLAKDDFPRETKKFIKKEAGKLTTIAKNTAKKECLNKTGNYLKGFKAGKVYNFAGDICCRAFNSSSHAHLVEYGHNMVTSRAKRNVGFVPGKYILTKSSTKFENKFEEDIEQFLENVLDKSLK